MRATRGEPVTPDMAAEMAGVSRNVIDVWAARGRLERLRLGRRVWFWSDDVYDLHRELNLRAAQDPTRDRNGKFVQRITTA